MLSATEKPEVGGSLSILRRTLSGGHPNKRTALARSRASGGSMNGKNDAGRADVDKSEGHQSCSQRLKYLLSKAEREDIRKEELVVHLEYIINVLDSTYVDETRGGFDADDDDELSKVEAEAVPTEVRDWLAQTFTRSTSSSATKRLAGDNKPRFRSVANAIRAGILVDRIYRRISSASGIHVPSNVAALLKNIDDWTFDVFAVNSMSDGNALKYVSYELLLRYDLISKFKISIPVLENFLVRLQQGYSKYGNPYHNLVHAADVTQTMHYVITRSGLSLWLTDLEVFAAVFAAMIHDYEHTGTTNTFHVNTGSDVALLYNDKAVLENHHLSAAFRLLKEDDYNVVSGLKLEEFREFRSLVIDVVLATDMSFHFQQIKNMKSHLSTPDSIDKTKALSLIVHCADISHPSKPWDLHHRWTELLIEEFFRQGDREETLGLPISPLCDRKNTLVAESQIGFIDFIVDPSMQVMGDMVEKIVQSFQQQQQQQTNNSTDDDVSRRSSNADVTCKTQAIGDDSSTSSSAAVTSASSTASSTSNTSQSPLSPECEFRRPWERCLVINKQMWKDRAARGWISPLQEPRTTDADGSRSQETDGPQRPDTATDEADSGVESPGPRSSSCSAPSDGSTSGLRHDDVTNRRDDLNSARVDSGRLATACCAADVKIGQPAQTTTTGVTSGLRQSNV